MPRKKKTTKRVLKKTDTKDPMQAHGKIEEENSRKSIYDLMNTKTVNPFGTSNATKFEDEMAQMNMHDLQRLAIKVGIIPSSNRTTLKNKLRREFNRYCGGQLSEKAYKAQQQNGPTVTPGSDVAKNIQKLLGM